MSLRCSRKQLSISWKRRPRKLALRSSGVCSKPNGTSLMRHWSSSIASVFPPAVVHADGSETVTVASRFTQRVPALELARQVCYHPEMQTHSMPGNEVLPPHHGIIIIRSLQEWACLLPQELPFAAVAR